MGTQLCIFSVYDCVMICGSVWCYHLSVKNEKKKMGFDVNSVYTNTCYSKFGVDYTFYYILENMAFILL